MKKILIAGAVLAVLAGCSAKDDSDPANGYSGMSVYTDHLTGCQYLGISGGSALTPRMDASGRQVCEPRAQ
ncbi:MAG TPA: DUF6440 family protein [Methanosarcina sp.]|nr:DUF6440 family protein [Methanosarcina sp.]